LPSNQTLINPSALPSSFLVSKLVAVILKRGPTFCSFKSRFWALDDSNMSSIVGILPFLLLLVDTKVFDDDGSLILLGRTLI